MKHEEERHKNHKFYVLRFMTEYMHTEYGTGCTAEERNDKQRFFRGAPFFIDCSFFIDSHGRKTDYRHYDHVNNYNYLVIKIRHFNSFIYFLFRRIYRRQPHAVACSGSRRWCQNSRYLYTDSIYMLFSRDTPSD